MYVLLVDNHDSYTYNLFQLIATAYGTPPHVVTNDSPEWATIDLDAFDAIVVSPGPGRPQVPRDTGVVPDVLASTSLPVLGVCLGHQALALLAGGDVVAAPAPRHGYLDRITHTGTDLFAGLPQQFTAVRYHSLCVARPLPAGLRELARSADGVVMGLRHASRPWWGVQFHPESVATEHGAALLANFARCAAAVRRARRHAPPPPARPERPEPTRPLRLHACTRRLPYAVDTEHAFRTLFAASPDAFWLDSSRVEEGLSRHSFLGDSSGALAETVGYDVGTGVATITTGDGVPEPAARSIFDVLDDRLAATTIGHDAEPPFDFGGGYVGFLGYELKADCGSPNTHVSQLPDAMWLRATRLVAVDHAAGQTWLIALARDDAGAREEAGAWLDAAAARLREPVPTGLGEARDDAPDGGVDPEPWLHRGRATYLADVETCLTELRAGESYEICLTDRASLPFTGDPYDLYRRMRASNPAPHAAFLRFGDTYLLCSSPERFLKVDRAGVVESKPIKGTVRRGRDEVEDEQLRKELASAAKVRAENLMIVDLVRNDLGRVCRVGTVEVPAFMQVESYATVHQLVSTVRGRLRDDVSAVHAARHCFPGGSMTGAPKLRTMEILDRLETTPRGVYSGAIGWFGFGGTADLNIVIRTAVVHDGRLDVGAGGAIVLDSDPEDEYEEMLLKARAPLRRLRPDEIG
ncbi:MAG TPA: aminodeoxychorismate synthase component I [Streptosporangiales bacterium]